MTDRHKALRELGERLAAEDGRYADTDHFFDYVQFNAGFAAAVEILLPMVEAVDLFDKPGGISGIKHALTDLDKRLNNKGDRE